MNNGKLEYDSSVGGSVVLGTHLPTFRYAAAALKEMQELNKIINNPNTTKLVFQTLPKHMRRRAMSHHMKRLPRKYRAAHVAQMNKSGTPQQRKRPSRKYRRRPKNLLSAYLRRQRKYKWLETHIWHAKRFRMVDRWGYRLPYSSYAKTYRASYRATTQHCLVQDISFYACIELQGRVVDIKKGFARLTSSCCTLSIAAKTYLSGRREGAIEIYKDGQYPYKALGKVYFIWCPILNTPTINHQTVGEQQVEEAGIEKEEYRTLWLWVHPVAYTSICEELIKVFQMEKQRYTKVPLQKTNTDDLMKKTTSKIQYITKVLTKQCIPLYKNSKSNVTLRELKGRLNRFRLTGRLAQSVLNQAFRVSDRSTTSCPDGLEQWIHTEFQHRNETQTAHCNQLNFWKKCQDGLTSPAEILSNLVLALNIDDPRIHRPQKRTKATYQNENKLYNNPQDILNNMPTDLSYSALWQESIRERLAKDIVTTAEYNSLRERQAIVPGLPCKFETDLQPVPVILIQRPGSQQNDYSRLSYGCGWDVIAPAGYGMIIWLSLIMWGSRPGGLRELETVARELSIEEHLPDTVAGLRIIDEKYLSLRQTYFSKPPNKRYNYQKLSIISPFRPPFLQLIRDWQYIADTTDTVESKQQQQQQQSIIENSNYFVLRDACKLQAITEGIRKWNSTKFPQIPSNDCLIQIKITMQTRGRPKDFSIICLPRNQDFKRQLRNLYKHNNKPIYTESLIPDPNEKERKQKRLEHKKLLKRLRARRVKEKRKIQETSTSKVYIKPANTAGIRAEQFAKMCKLWLPEDIHTLFNVRLQAEREVFGYITIANYCLTEGRYNAIGYITLGGLKQLLIICRKYHLKQPQCLIRSTNSRHYRFAYFKINLNP